MKFLYGPTREGIFVGVNEKSPLELDKVRELFSRTGVWYMDLDDCLVKSPAKEMARRAVGTNHTNLDYLQWCISTAFELMVHGETAESRTWLEYVNNFLKDDMFEEALYRFAEDYAESSLFPGVEDLVAFANGTRKVIVTRNVPAIAEVYAQKFGTGFVANAWNKKEVVRKDYRGGSGFVSVMGNSGEDVEMLEPFALNSRALFYVLKSHRQRLLEISDPVVYTSRDRRGLVEILSK